jgi:N-acyl-D-aspartate/D-glutamate deacylase
MSTFDTRIRKVSVYDGGDPASEEADIAIRGNHIAAIESGFNMRALGLVKDECPALTATFIDAHT